MRYPLLYIFSFFLATTGCIQEIEPFTENVPTLVISGSISTLEGPHSVSIYYTTGFNLDPAEYVEDAVVWIVDDLGNVEELFHDGRGLYYTSQFAGIPDRSYHIEVLMSSDVCYASIPDRIETVPEISQITYAKGENNDIVNIFVDFKDPSETDNYYKWRYRATYKIEAPFAGTDEGPVRKDCWANTYDFQYLRIEDDQLFDGLQLEKFQIASIEFNRFFNHGYYLTVEQQSLSLEAYEYWNAIKNQRENTGSILETANYQIRGNVYNIHNSDEIVLGYFQASESKEHMIYIDEFINYFGPDECPLLPQRFGPPRAIDRCYDCTLYTGDATTEKPGFWPE